MCGIWAYYSKDENKNKEILNNYEYYYNQLKARGPDMTRKLSTLNISFVFHRLAINDLHQEACMPFEDNNIIMICNGEIYNHTQLEEKYNIKPNTTCDCEIIIHLYHKLKEECLSNNNEINYRKLIYRLCNLLDGEFAFIIYDKDTKNLFYGRDPYGVRPLFIGIKNGTSDIILSSELKGINTSEFSTQQVKAGSFGLYYNKLFHPLTTDLYIDNINIDEKLQNKSNISLINNPNKMLYTNIRDFFIEAVEKRVKNSDRKVACLLSGGLDSSLVASIASRYFEPYTLETYCIGLEGSPDMISAQQVADFIKSKHKNIIITEEDMLNAIEEVIRIIESYDTTTVRASIGNYLVAKYISENSDAKVLLTGEYSDEIFFSYIYSKYMDKERIFYEENWRLVKNIQYYDSLRADRVISGNGLEARVPFSDRKFVEYVMNIHPSIKMPKNCQDIEKFILRKAFDDGEKTLPDEILWRVKEAFSDGISTKKKSWFEILQEYINNQISDKEYEENKDKYTHIKVKNKEMYYYVKIFSKYYHNQSIIPELWVPRDKDGKIFTHEPSARILKDIYE